MNPHARARELLADIGGPEPLIYWSDMLGSALLGWTALGVATWAQAVLVPRRPRAERSEVSCRRSRYESARAPK